MSKRDRSHEKILQALAAESSELARILKILRQKLEKTKHWLPDTLDTVPVAERVYLTVHVETAIGQEILAVAKKEKTITKQLKVLDAKKPKKPKKPKKHQKTKKRTTKRE